MAILGDFEEFEGPVPEPPYPYHHRNISLSMRTPRRVVGNFKGRGELKPKQNHQSEGYRDNF